MTRPSSLVIAGHEYVVRWVDDPTAALARHASADSVGHAEHEAGVIAVRVSKGESSPTQERDTLLHEVLHAVVAMTYLKDALKDSERVVSTLATHLLDTLRRNPGLAEYLAEVAA